MTAIDPAQYRTVLGTFPTGVTVIAGLDGDEPVGLAVGSFFSISLDPALVGFCVAKTSGSWPRIRTGGSFCVNVLAADQEDVCRTFATSGTDKFATIGWSSSATGSPRINGVVAWIDCRLEVVHEAGDHDIVIGRVVDLAVERDTLPLVFLGGRYAALT